MDVKDGGPIDPKLQARAQQLAEEFADSSSTAADLNQLMRLMMKAGLERMLDTEMDVHLGRKGSPAEGEPPAEPPKPGPPNRRNGRSQKRVQGELGEIKLETPRDRDGTFEPKIVEPACIATRPAPHPGLRREDPRALRQGDDDA